MKQYVVLIRHGGTKSGVEGRYVGTLDEPLLDSAKEEITNKANRGVYPRAEMVFTSAQQRCRETARLIYPMIPSIVMDRLGALDVGACTGRRYHEIAGDEGFAHWADNRQLLPLGQGEPPHLFYTRCMLAFQDIVREAVSKGVKTAAVITHKMVIVSLIQRFCIPRSPYKNWAVPYGNGYLLQYDTILKVARMKEVF